MQTNEPRRRMDDRRRVSDRRATRSRTGAHVPGFPEQRTQAFTRYLFLGLYLAYINLGAATGEPVVSWFWLHVAAAVYFLLISAYLWHAAERVYSPLRWRLAMWTDLAIVTIGALGDASPASPLFLAFIMVILGNGMRYGLRFFAEAVVGTFLLGGWSMWLKASAGPMPTQAVFFFVYAVLIVLYAFYLMTQIERVRRDLEAETGQDALTGLLNRRGLQERASHLFSAMERQDGREVAVLFADLDGFKGVNDTRGHHVGDRVLRQVGALIRDCVRDGDIAARFGGDEFVVILPDTDLVLATRVAERVRGAINESNLGTDIGVSVSIGLGVAPRHGHDLSSVLQRVDAAMYESKNAPGGIRCATVDAVRPVPRAAGAR